MWRYGLLLSRNRHVAEDLVQATCLRALEQADRYVAGTRMDRWLLSLLHSIWLNEVRERRAQDANTEGWLSEYAAQIDGMAVQVICRVDALPEFQRETVYLSYVEGFSYQEVADILQVPIASVMSRLVAARLKLAEYPPEVVDEHPVG